MNSMTPWATAAVCGLLSSVAMAGPDLYIEAELQVYDVDEDGVVLGEYTGDVEGVIEIHPSDSAVSYAVCTCTVLGIGSPDDELWVRIVEPHAGHVFWTIIVATGDLHGIHGRGELMFDAETQSGDAWGKVHWGSPPIR